MLKPPKKLRNEGIAAETWHFSLLMAFFWASIVTVEAFLVPYLTSIGFGSRDAGLVMSSIFLAAIFSAPLWGAVCDATQRHRHVLVFALAGGLCAILLIPVAAPLLAPVLILGAAYSATGNSMPAILDSWIMRRKARQPRLEYGIARGFGAAGFALGGVLLGQLSDLFGPSVLFPAYAVFVSIAIVIVLRLPSPDRHRGPEGPALDRGEFSTSELVHAETDRPVVAAGPRIRGDAIRAVLSSGAYLVFLAISLLIFIQLRAALTFLPLLIYETGGTNIHVGLSQTVSAGSEVPFMFAAAFLLHRFRPRALLTFAMMVFVFRIGLMGWIYSAQGLVALQLLHGLSFGIFLPVSVHYIDRIAPAKYASIFQTLAPSIYFGLGSVIGSSLGGSIVEQYGLRTMYRMLWLPVLVATVLFALYLLYQRASRAANG